MSARARMFATICAVICSGAATASRAQTVHPVVAEYAGGGKVEGRFEVVNDGPAPLLAVIEPRSFDLSEDGEPIDRPLDPGLHLKVSATALRIPPRQSRIVLYEVTADSAPGWFVIHCRLSSPPRRDGLETRTERSHTVYLLPSGSPSRHDFLIRSAVRLPTQGAVELVLENRGDRLALAQEVEVVAEGHRARHASFPLLPHRRRRVRVPWDFAVEPDRVVIRLAHFTLERSLRETARAGD